MTKWLEHLDRRLDRMELALDELLDLARADLGVEELSDHGAGWPTVFVKPDSEPEHCPLRQFAVQPGSGERLRPVVDRRCNQFMSHVVDVLLVKMEATMGRMMPNGADGGAALDNWPAEPVAYTHWLRAYGLLHWKHPGDDAAEWDPESPVTAFSSALTHFRNELERAGVPPWSASLPADVAAAYEGRPTDWVWAMRRGHSEEVAPRQLYPIRIKPAYFATSAEPTEGWWPVWTILQYTAALLQDLPLDAVGVPVRPEGRPESARQTALRLAEMDPGNLAALLRVSDYEAMGLWDLEGLGAMAACRDRWYRALKRSHLAWAQVWRHLRANEAPPFGFDAANAHDVIVQIRGLRRRLPKPDRPPVPAEVRSFCNQQLKVLRDIHDGKAHWRSLHVDLQQCLAFSGPDAAQRSVPAEPRQEAWMLYRCLVAVGTGRVTKRLGESWSQAYKRYLRQIRVMPEQQVDRPIQRTHPLDPERTADPGQ